MNRFLDALTAFGYCCCHAKEAHVRGLALFYNLLSVFSFSFFLCPSGRCFLENHVFFGIARHWSSEVLEFLDSLKNFENLGVPKGAGTESAEGFDLARMYRLLSAFGDPLSCYPVIHVAGTKGKGSTAAFIGNILRAEGYSVGSYTSPHIMSIHERIVAGKSEDPITPDAFQKLFEDNRKMLEEAIAAEQGALTYFEVLSVLAFQYFAQVNVDIAVVEAGLGGARDATNVISAAGLIVAVITNIGKEHSVALGGSLESIALAKSGIIKQGRPKLDKKSLQLRMLGPHQLNNALTAICTILCIRDQGWRIKEDAIWSGLERTFTLGRFQVMPKAESIRLGCDLSTLVLDGAHTASSAKALASTLKIAFPYDSVALVIAMASDKDHHGFCQELLQGSAPKVVVVTESMVAGGKYRSTAASVLVDCWCQAARTKKLEVLHALTKDDVKGSKPDSVITITDSESIVSAIKKASDLLIATKKKGVVCVTGSLYAVSEVLSYLKADSLAST